MSKYLTVKQVAARLSLSTASIQHKCESGELRAWRFHEGCVWRIDPGSVDTVFRNRERAYTIAEACTILEVEENKVRRLIRDGYLKAFRGEDGRRHRLQTFIRIGSLNQFIMRCLNEGGISPELIAEKRKLLRDPEQSSIGE